ncbi:lantibiotic dehydratase [Streptomyces lavendulae]|uniref:lantibiotic dehydratase n=1 Tax=Streptomyces lavendulae TaxID=1914 RepID=UPI0036B284E8
MTPPSPVVRTAPYALVRATTLSHPAQSPDTASFREGMERLTRLAGESARLLPRLTDALYASRGGHPDSFHRDVVLPLRRALHNGREPRPAVLAGLGDLPERVPLLREWLELRERLASARALQAGSAPAALAAERGVLAAWCREPAFALAASATSADLLAAVERAAAGAEGRRARKEEPGVLRHAVRAATRSSPVSWFTAVGWGPLGDGPAPAEGAGSDWGDGDLLGPTGNHVRTSRSLVAALCEALLADPRRRARLPHRMASAARTAEGRATFARTRGSSAVGRFLVTDEDEVEVVASAPLERVAELCRTPATPAELAAALAAPQDRAAALGYVDQLVDAGLLVPVPPVGPQDHDPLGVLAAWLRSAGGEGGADGARTDAALAASLDEIADATGKFGAADPHGRVALLAFLRGRWTALLASAGRALPPDNPVPPVLTEDVVARRPVAAGALFTAADHEALREVAALAELFDLGHLARRALRDRFVARYGRGGVCHPVWDFGKETVRAWEDTVRDAFPGPDEDLTALPTGAAELVRLRAAFEAEVSARTGSPEDPDADVVLPPELVGDFAARLPGWAAGRPLSYAHFVQQDAERGLLCVNHTYGGWGRVGSRFLGLLDPEATSTVAREVAGGTGPGSRPVQFRPVHGFNANLQPRFLPDEVVAEEHGPPGTPDGSRPPIDDRDVELFHDEADDQVRLRLRGTGERLDVLYPGLLVTGLLTTRSAPLVHDHPEGVVSFASLVPRRVTEVPGGQLVRTPRLRHRHVVLRRRRWKLAPGTVTALRGDLAAAGSEVPFEAVARWRALLGVPDQLFLHPPIGAPADTGGTEEGAPARSAQPKPQFVDLGNALHLRCLDRWLARHPDGLVLEEALPAPGARPRATRAVEVVVETYREGCAS